MEDVETADALEHEEFAGSGSEDQSYGEQTLAYPVSMWGPEDLPSSSSEFGTGRKWNPHHMTYLSCPECDKMMYNKQGLMHHRVEQHNFVPDFKCERCGVMLTDKLEIQCHIANHNKEKSFVCRMCQDKFTTFTSLVRHIRYKHTQERAFKCTLCDFAAVEHNKLQIHIRSHTGETPYKCLECGRRFRSKVSLTRHNAAAHAAYREYICTLCFMEFPISNSLRVHLRHVHDVNKNEYLDGVNNTKLNGVPEELNRYIEHKKINMEQRKFKYYVIKDMYRNNMSTYFKNISPLLLHDLEMPGSSSVEDVEQKPKRGRRWTRKQQVQKDLTQCFKQEGPDTEDQYAAVETYSAQPLDEAAAGVDTLVDYSEGKSEVGGDTRVDDNMLSSILVSTPTAMGFGRQEAVDMSAEQQPHSKGKRKRKQKNSVKKTRKTEAVDDSGMIRIEPLKIATEEDVWADQTDFAESYHYKGSLEATGMSSDAEDGYASTHANIPESTFTLIKSTKREPSIFSPHSIDGQLQEERVYEFVYEDNNTLIKVGKSEAFEDNDTLIPAEKAGVSSCVQDDTPADLAGIVQENADSLPVPPDDIPTVAAGIVQENIESLAVSPEDTPAALTQDKQVCKTTDSPSKRTNRNIPVKIQTEKEQPKETVTNVKQTTRSPDPLVQDGNDKNQQRKNLDKICTRLRDDAQLRKLKDGVYGKRPQVIEVTEDGRILDITENYREFLPL